MVVHGLMLPASQLYGFIFPFHLCLYLIALLAIPVVVYGRKRGAERIEKGPRYWLSVYLFPFIGLHSLFFAGLVASWVAVVIFHAFVPEAALYSLLAAYGFALLGLVISYRGPRVIKVDISAKNEKPLSFVQLSDLHIGSTVSARYVRNVVNKTLAINPDCIVLTGDIGDAEPRRHVDAIQELARLKAPLGVFLVLGNHEMYWPTEEWVKAFRSCGFEVLIDEQRDLVWQRKHFSLVGLAPMNGKKIADIYQRKDAHELIVLSHYPNRAQEAAAAGAKLFLAGHTHGGQFWPWSWFIYLFHRYAKGLYRIGPTSVYVNRGTGHWGPPFRFGQRAEITWLVV